jgi:hypothetical protein
LARLESGQRIEPQHGRIGQHSGSRFTIAVPDLGHIPQ